MRTKPPKPRKDKRLMGLALRITSGAGACTEVLPVMLALTIGICFGIYSSVFVGAAVAMWLGISREDMVKPITKDNDPGDENSGAVV